MTDESSTRGSLPLGARFVIRDDGQVDVRLEADHAVFEDAFNDCVSSLPPRGHPANGPSTYWIDHALEGLRRAQLTCSARPFSWGNTALLQVTDGRVEARHDYWDDDEVGDFASIEDVKVLLEAWRRAVAAQNASATQPLPETYRRNPAFDRRAKVHCPRCGSVMEEVDGELTCLPGHMGVAFDMRAALTHIVTDPPTCPVRQTAQTFTWGGTWRCPADASPMVEETGNLLCRECGRHLPPRVIHQLIEFHPHQRQNDRGAE